MTIYIVLLLFTLISHIFYTKGFIYNKKAKVYFLNSVFFLIYLVFILRDSTVGRDTAGYERAYLLTKNIPWGDFSYIYFEKGYILLMKICILLGMSFQHFLMIVYAIVILPIYLFIKKYSKNTLISVLIYICYIRLEFDMTGIRQALAMSIVLIGYMLFLEVKKKKVLIYLLFVTLAGFFHSGAYVSYLFVLILPLKSKITYTTALLAVMVGSLVARSNIFQIIKELFEKDSFELNAQLNFGGNTIFLLILTVFFLVAHQKKELAKISGCEKLEFNVRNYNIEDLNIKMFMLSVFLVIFFGYETSARSYMFMNQTIIILLPSAINKFEYKIRLLMNMYFCVFFIGFFFYNTIIPNNFDILPYRFFWQ